MKKIFLKFTGKKLLPVFAITASLLAGAPIVSMANNTSNIEILSPAENNSSVQFVGAEDNALLFNVKIDNPNEDNFTLIIKNDDGYVLFSKNYSEKSFLKTIKLLKDDNTKNYNFIIRSSNKGLENTYSVSTTTRTVEDVVVTKL